MVQTESTGSDLNWFSHVGFPFLVEVPKGDHLLKFWVLWATVMRSTIEGAGLDECVLFHLPGASIFPKGHLCMKALSEEL